MDEQTDNQGEGRTDEDADLLAAARAAWDCMANWTQAERDVWEMGPFDGGIPGMVRRVRRILDVSQRGLAALLDVSQSAVARWETGRTSPRMSVMERLLRMARLRMRFEDEETAEPVGPMRADGARKHGGSRYPAHTDLTATGWWVPRRLRTMTSIEAFRARDRSRRVGDPAIRHRVSAYWRRIERLMYGTPDDHPAVHQLVAEVRYLDECREDRRRAR
ncbi:helix-turn-helix domain-containing protein [Nocardioides baculatus]|uniref:Helix-turn-helix transcriptional regulator n=1 Tax=Nocardioides baculatus TaxID=2801337 RepID=A0ABS1L6D4_9ACTN|nr:helix-turn-helix transcriptional regulator [Nocardioides baculatus]MBL0747241.1 helix-turn-helix transcriptional regulator [Nocardioides baculatus]